MSKASLGYKGHLRPEQFSLKKKSKTEAGNVAQVKGLPSKRIASGLYKGGVLKRRVVSGRHFSSAVLPLALPGDNVKCQVVKGCLYCLPGVPPFSFCLLCRSLWSKSSHMGTMEQMWKENLINQ